MSGWRWVRAALRDLASKIGLNALIDEYEAGREQAKTKRSLLDIATPTWTPDSSPAALLRADFGIVRFHGRTDELTDLSAWCDGDGKVALRLYTAPGGFGKTRLLRELIHWRRDLGWDAGFLPEGAILEHGSDALFDGPGKALLLVLDYAESRGEEIQAVVTAARDSSRDQVRIVLLARSEGDWWGELQAAGNGVGDFFQGPQVEGPLRLQPLTDSAESRQTSYAEAVQAFAKELGRPVPPGAPSLDHEDFERVLLVHATALAAVEGETVPPEGLLDWLLKREERGLRRVREDRGLGQEMDRALRHAATLLTLAQGADSRAETVKVVRRASSLEDQPHAMLEEIAEALHVLYRGRRWCDGVEPDLVGEHLVRNQLQDAPRLLDAAFGKGVPAARLESGLTVLNRLAQRMPEQGRSLLTQAFRDRLEWLGIPAMKVAVESGDPIGLVFADELAENGDAELARELEPHLPYPTTALRKASVAIRGLLQRELFERGKEDLSEEELAELAGWSNDLSVSLSDMGRREEALAASQEAVEVYRELTAARPDAFRPDLAMGLNNLSNRLSNLGRREEALAASQEAVEIYRELAATRPDVFRPDLAMSLNNLSTFLSDVGRREEALAASKEAVEIYRELAAARPDAFRPDLATSLNNLSAVLSNLDRREEALAASKEAVEIRRELAATRPDAFRPDLATSLNNLSLHLADLAWQEEALAASQEAVEIYRELTAARPDAFRTDLAMSLNNLSAVLSNLGRREEALATSKEAVEIYRELAAVRPDSFQPDLAMSLGALHLRCRETGDDAGALKTIREALDLIEPYFRRLPAAFAGLTYVLCRDYEGTAQACGVEPDEERLREIREILAALEKG